MGVTLDDKICQKHQINQVRTKLANSIAPLGNIIQTVTQRLILYSLLLTPYLTYCVEVWGDTKQFTTMISITKESKQNHKQSRVQGADKHTVLKFVDLVKFRTAQIMFKACNTVLPGNIQRLLCDREEGQNLRGELKTCCIVYV